MSGARFVKIAEDSDPPIDDLLGVYTGAISFVLQTIIEQGVALLAKFEESVGRSLSPAAAQFPDHLRFGVPSAPARVLAAGGVRHRSAGVLLGAALVSSGIISEDRMTIFAAAKRLLQQDPQGWNTLLGALVANNTVEDINKVTGD